MSHDTAAIRVGAEKDLRDANLRGVYLRLADVRDADVRDAYLRDANLHRADLRGADLQGADLRDANLHRADLRDADLRDADLRDADLQDADLRGADLRGADLQEAYLRDANLRNADLPAYERLSDSDSFVAYKGCKGHVVKLEVPADAERVSSLIGSKCRAEYANVIEVLNENGEPCDSTVAYGWYDESFEYREGETVDPDSWDDDIRVQCTHGIHIYPTKREAIDAVR